MIEMNERKAFFLQQIILKQKVIDMWCQHKNSYFDVLFQILSIISFEIFYDVIGKQHYNRNMNRIKLDSINYKKPSVIENASLYFLLL